MTRNRKKSTDGGNVASSHHSLQAFTAFVRMQKAKADEISHPVSNRNIKEKVVISHRKEYILPVGPLQLFAAFNKLNREDQIELVQQIEVKTGVVGLSEALSRQNVDITRVLSPGPKVAPELYADADPNENVVDFVNRVYGEPGWLDGFFGRRHLKELDSKCLKALDNFERKHGKSDILLPTSKELNDTLASPGIFERLPSSEQRRLQSVFRNREDVMPEVFSYLM